MNLETFQVREHLQALEPAVRGDRRALDWYTPSSLASCVGQHAPDSSKTDLEKMWASGPSVVAVRVFMPHLPLALRCAQMNHVSWTCRTGDLSRLCAGCTENTVRQGDAQKICVIFRAKRTHSFKADVYLQLYARTSRGSSTQSTRTGSLCWRFLQPLYVVVAR